MSRTVDLFFDSDQPVELFAESLGELVGARLRATPDGSRYVLQAGEVTAYLGEHDFLDDDDLPLSEFRYVLSAQVPYAGDLEDSGAARYLRYVNSLWRRATGLPSLLVMDLGWPDRAQVASAAGEPPGTADAGASLVGASGAREAWDQGDGPWPPCAEPDQSTSADTLGGAAGLASGAGGARRTTSS